MITSRTRVLRAIATVGIVAALPALAAATTAAAPAGPGSLGPIAVSGATPFTADCSRPNPPVPPSLGTEVEPYVAVNPQNPRNLVSVYQQDRFVNDGANGVLASVSANGGKTWQVPPLTQQPTFSACAGGTAANGGDFEKTTDPWIDFSPTGRAYFASVSYNDSDWDTAEFVATSENGGRTWSRPATIVRENIPGVIDDRGAVTADRTLPANAYLVYARAIVSPASAATGAAYYSRTTDGGRTWSPARAIYQAPLGMETSANQIVELPSGELIDVFNLTPMESDFGSGQPRHDAVMAVRSTDHGVTWSAATTILTNEISGVVDPGTGKPVRVGDNFTHIAVDPRPGTSNVYAVWGDSRFTGGTTEQIAFAASTDGGRSWSRPALVSASASSAFAPAVAVNAAGQVGVAYYEIAPGATASTPLATSYRFAVSDDRGASWTGRRDLTSRPFDLRGAPYDGGYFLGEYEGFTAAGAAFVATATFVNDGDTANPTDVFAVSVTPPAPTAAH
jgi:hypothetical protein